MDFVEYRLRFRNPLRLGHAHHNQAAIGYPRLHSDLLYHALIHAHAELFGKPVESAFDGWPNAPTTRISSAFPFTAEHGSLAPAPAHLGDSTVCLVRRDSPHAGPVTPLEWWAVTVRDRAGINRVSQRHLSKFRVVEAWFQPDAGLWFGARFLTDTARSTFEAALRYLGDTGIGGGRSGGAGGFDIVAINPISAPSPASSSLWWCLSRYRPSETEFADGALLKSPAVPVWSSWPIPNSVDELPFLGEGTTLAAHNGFDPYRAGTVFKTPSRLAQPASALRPGFCFALPLTP